MGYFRFRRSIKLMPGLHLTVNKTCLSLSAGPRGLSYTVNTKGGKRVSVGLPGTGISYTAVLHDAKEHE